MDKLEWIMQRTKGIDACDVAAIMGIDKKRNALDVYIEKTGRIKKNNIIEDALYFEIKLEELVSREFAIRTSLVVRKDLRPQCDKDYKFMIANIDRKISGENAILECKVIKNDEASDFEEELLNSYPLQAQHNMKVKGADVYYIAALINSERFIYKKFNRDDELISKIVEAEKDFWINHVEKKVRPNINEK
jgi:putative phage-type endonuclease